MITREKIEARKAELEENKATCIANLQAVVGALQDCEYWLKQLKDQEDESQEG